MTDATYVYFSTQARDIDRVAIAGGPPETLLPRSSVYSALRLQSGVLYFQDQTSALLSMSATGRQPTLLAEGPFRGVVLTVDPFFAYLTTGNDPYNQTFVKIPISGGTAATIDGQAGEPIGVVTDSQSLYFQDETNGEIVKLGIADGQRTVLTRVAGTCSDYLLRGAVAVDSTSVYWGEADRVMSLTPK